MMCLTQTKNFSFWAVKSIGKDKQLVEKLNQLRKSLQQTSMVEENLRKYAQLLKQLQSEQINFEWQPRLTIKRAPTKSQSVQFEIYNWLTILLQNHLQSVIQSGTTAEIIKQLQKAMGIIQILNDPSKFNQFYDLQPIQYFVIGVVNFYLTLLMDENDNAAQFSQSAQTPYRYVFSTVLLSLENLSKIGKTQDKFFNSLTTIFKAVQEARMLYMQRASIKEIQQCLNEAQQVELPEEVVQQLYKRVNPLINRIFCEKCEQQNEIEAVFQNAIPAIELSDVFDFVV